MATRPTPKPAATMTIEHEDPMMEAARSLGQLATAQELTVKQERSLFGDIVTAQPVQVRRDEAGILLKIDAIAAAAGQRFFYRYPVWNKAKGRQDHIEGPTVKCTNAVMAAYKNCAIESRTVMVPGADTFVCYSRFCDWENGVSFTKGQLVPASATLGGQDEERRQQIAHNVGQSKSQRNVIEAALSEYVHRAFLVAKKGLVDRIGRNIDRSRVVIVEELNKLGVANLVPRVERIYGRKSGEWLAPDIASVYAELSGINDGMSSIDETWPLAPPPEPRRDDEISAATSIPSGGEHGGPASQTQMPHSPPAADEGTAKGGAGDAGLSKK